MNTITVDVLHPLLALRLAVVGKLRGQRVRWLLTATGWQGRLSRLLLRLAGAQVEEWRPSMVDSGRGNDWHLVQRRLAASGLALGERVRDGMTGGPEPCRARLAAMLQIQLLTELSTAAGAVAMLRDSNPGDVLWLARTRAEYLLDDPPWTLPPGLRLCRHHLWAPFSVQRKSGYYLGGGQIQLLARSSWAGLFVAVTLVVLGLVRNWCAGGQPAAVLRSPFAIFLLPNEVGRIVTGFGWLAKSGLQPLALLPAPAENTMKVLDFPCSSLVGYGFGRDLLQTRAEDWVGYGRALALVWSTRTQSRLPLALWVWFWHQRLELLRREAFFVAVFQRYQTRLVWMMAQFEVLQSAAVASAVLRLGGECWGGCNSMVDGLDSFVFRANANRVFTWGERDAALYRASGTVETTEAIGYPDAINEYCHRANQLREKLHSEGFSRIVALYDNNFGEDLMITPADYTKLFAAGRQILDDVPGTVLLVKSKDRAILERGLGENWQSWQDDHRVRFDFERSNLAPALAADIVIGIMLSGPGVLAASQGVVTLSLDTAGYQDHTPAVGTDNFCYHADSGALVAAARILLDQLTPRKPEASAAVSVPQAGTSRLAQLVVEFLGR